MAGTIEDDDLAPMPIKIRSDPSQDSFEIEVIPEEKVNTIYDFYMSTNGCILVFCLVCVVLFIQYATNTHGIVFNRFFQYNSIINSNPNHLRDMIREASINAKSVGAISTIHIDRYEIVEEKGFQFVISLGTAYSSTIKDKVATLKGAADDDRITPSDPLDPASVHNNLLVINYEEEFKRPYSILLNKFNTIADHCLLVTNEYAPQITPLTGSDLSLLYSIVYQTNGVGFYNSNILAGASQKHKHMQFIPMDETWKYRDVDAQYGIPIDDFIMPNIENGHWKSIHCYEHRVNKKYRDDVYHVPQFGFQHGIAVLKVSGEFATVEDHAAYLQCVYETLLSINEIQLESLQQCAAEATVEETEENRRLAINNNESDVKEISKGRNKIAYGQHKHRAREQHHRQLEEDEVTFSDKLVESNEPQVKIDCQGKEVAYNLVMTSSYMMIVPRSEKAFHDKITVNSFGFLGFMMARGTESLELIKTEGPLGVLKGVTAPKKYHSYHEH